MATNFPLIRYHPCARHSHEPSLHQMAPVQIGGAGRLSSGFDEREQAMSQLIDIDRLFNGRHFDREVTVLCVRWYLRYKLSLRDLVEIMAERGLSLAHTTIMRWVKRFTPDPADIPRFRALGILANFQTLWAHPSPEADAIAPSGFFRMENE